MTGTLEHIYLVAEKRGETEARKKIELEAGLGIVGDRYHTYARRCLAAEDPVPENHLSLIDKSVLDDFLANQAKDLGVEYADFRRSLITSGTDLNALGDKALMVGTARCRCIELCAPCAFHAATLHRAVLPGH